MSAKAIFLDRDGVINHDEGYTYQVEKLKLLDDVASCLKQLKSAGFQLVVITNQSGVARGMYGLNDVYRFHLALQQQLQQEAHVTIDHFYICPHHPEGQVAAFAISCECRKPGHLNIERAIRDLGISRSSSYMIGDRSSDVEAGERAKLKKCFLVSPQLSFSAITQEILTAR